MVQITLARPTVMQNLDGINSIIQMKVQNHRKTNKNFEALFIALWKPDLNKQKDF